jgi:hypothetical protein
MAQIDPSIALQFRQPQIQDPINQFAKAQEVSVNALKMREMERGLQEEEQVRNYLAGADLAKPETRAGLAKFGKAGLATGKLLAEQEKAGLETRKLTNEIEKQDLIKTRERLSDLAFNPSNENIIAHLQDSVLRKQMTPEQAEAMLAQVTNMPIEQRKQTLLQMGVDAAKRLEQMTVSAAQQQTANITMRGQNLTDARAREGQRLQYDPELQATLAGARAGGEAKGKATAMAQINLPKAISDAEAAISLIDQMIGTEPVVKGGRVVQQGTKPHPGFSDYVGATYLPGARTVEGSDAASYEIFQKQIEGAAFLEAFEALKGGGHITEIEGTKATQAKLRMNKAQSEADYIKGAREYQAVVRKGLERARAAARSSGGAGGGKTEDPLGIR